METFISAAATVAIIAEQVAYRLYLPYPYKYGLLVYQTKEAIPEIYLWHAQKFKKTNLRHKFTKFTSTLIFDQQALPNEINFYRFIYGNSFKTIFFLLPIFFSCQIRNSKTGQPTLQIRIGYIMALFLLFLLGTAFVAKDHVLLVLGIGVPVWVIAQLYLSIRAFRRYQKIILT